MSREWRVCFFATNAANLESYTSPTEYNFRVFVMNMANGVITRQMPKINSGDVYITQTDISGDGSTVAFATFGSIYGEDYNGKRDVYASDVQSASSYLIGRQFFTLLPSIPKGLELGAFSLGAGTFFDSYNRLVAEGREYQREQPEFTLLIRVKLFSFRLGASRAQVSREVFSPKTGDYAFVRTVDVISNKTNTSGKFDVSYFGNLGSNERTQVFATSDGDLIIEPTDTWFRNRR